MKENNYGYYSKLLKTPFDTLEELKAAEAEFNKKNEAEQKLKEERKADSHAVSDAYAQYLKVCKDAHKAIQDARENWETKRQEFINKYNSYHMTYTNIDGKEEALLDTTSGSKEIKTNTLIDDLLEETLENFGSLFRKLV